MRQQGGELFVMQARSYGPFDEPSIDRSGRRMRGNSDVGRDQSGFFRRHASIIRLDFGLRRAVAQQNRKRNYARPLEPKLHGSEVYPDLCSRANGLFRCNLRGAFLYCTERSFVKTLTVFFGMFLALSGTVLADGDEAIPFSVGEKLTYQIFWGPFVVGRATL